MIITYVPNPTIKDDWSALTPVCFFTRFAVPQFTRQASPPPPPSSSPPQPSRPPALFLLLGLPAGQTFDKSCEEM